MWKAGLDRADGIQGAGRGVVLLTELTAVRGGSWPRPAHLSLPFWMEAWPRLALSKSGEFLLRFVLVERMLFCGGERTRLCYRKPVSLAGSQHPFPASFPQEQAQSGTAACFSSGLSQQKGLGGEVR